MPTPLLTSLFGNAGLLYGIVFPLVTILLFGIFLIASLHGGTHDAQGIGKAVYCYLAQFVGIVLMTLGSLPTVYAVIAGSALPTPTYLSLLAIFAVGGLTFLWHDALVQEVAQSTRQIPFVIYFFTIKFIGTVAILLSALTLLLVPTLGGTGLPFNWWVMPLVVLLYGLLLAWFTRTKEGEWNIFQTRPIHTRRAASAPRRLVRKKKATKKRKK